MELRTSHKAMEQRAKCARKLAQISTCGRQKSSRALIRLEVLTLGTRGLGGAQKRPMHSWVRKVVSCTRPLVWWRRRGRASVVLGGEEWRETCAQQVCERCMHRKHMVEERLRAIGATVGGGAAVGGAAAGGGGAAPVGHVSHVDRHVSRL